MATKKRKVRRLRGSRTHGWGTSGQHRKAGMRGGHGKAGWCKHKWTYTVKYDLARIGKHGFICPTGRGELKTINVGDLDQLLSTTKDKEGATLAGEQVTLNLKELGYQKLLGAGRVTRPYRLLVDEWSKTAQKKIEGAGGAVEQASAKVKG